MEIANKWDNTTTSLCLLYAKTTKTNEHVFQCEYHHIARVRSEHIYKLNTTLAGQQTVPIIQQHIINHITNWIEGRPSPILLPSVDPFYQNLANVCRIQNKIGWDGKNFKSFVTDEMEPKRHLMETDG